MSIELFCSTVGACLGSHLIFFFKKIYFVYFFAAPVVLALAAF